MRSKKLRVTYILKLERKRIIAPSYENQQVGSSSLDIAPLRFSCHLGAVCTWAFSRDNQVKEIRVLVCCKINKTLQVNIIWHPQVLLSLWVQLAHAKALKNTL